MKKNRSTKELLNLTLEHGNKHFEKGDDDYPYGYMGLCGLHRIMYFKYEILNIKEYQILYDFLNDHKPRKTEGLKGYYWEKGQWKPRQKWLRYHINKIKK